MKLANTTKSSTKPSGRDTQRAPLRIRGALLSVYDKNGLADLSRVLYDTGVRIESTGGTAAFLVKQGVPVETIDSGGLPDRVKTLQADIFSRVLARGEDPEDQAFLRSRRLHEKPLDLVVVNFYQGGVIDIGGPALVRAAAKNFESTVVLVAPDQYDEFMTRFMSDHLDLDYRRGLALRAFQTTANYDVRIQQSFYS